MKIKITTNKSVEILLPRKRIDDLKRMILGYYGIDFDDKGLLKFIKKYPDILKYIQENSFTDTLERGDIAGWLVDYVTNGKYTDWTINGDTALYKKKFFATLVKCCERKKIKNIFDRLLEKK